MNTPLLEKQRDAEWVRRTREDGPKGPVPVHVAASLDLLVSAASVITGQDAVTAGYTSAGQGFYAGYVPGGGAYVSYPALRSIHPGSKVLAITIANGEYGCDVFDMEPGAGTIGGVTEFVLHSTHPNSSLPIIYCSAWQGQEVINVLAANGIARNRYYLWLAHWTGFHICGPHSCGYPAADMSQYSSTRYIDYDAAYSYVFGPVVTPDAKVYPVQSGSTGPLVTAAQNGLNKWETLTGSVNLTVDGHFGPATKAATIKAQEYFGQRGVTAGQVTQWLMNQLAFSLWPMKAGMVGTRVEALQKNLNRWVKVLGIRDLIAVDGQYGAITAKYVKDAQEHFGERGVTAGQCSQSVYNKLGGTPK